MSPAVLWHDTIQPGASWSLLLRRGHELRMEDSEGGVNVAALFYNYECPTERYNMPDTLKAQHTAHLTKGFVLYSDMGRILCSITDDTRGWHDPLSGHNDARAVLAKSRSQAAQWCTTANRLFAATLGPAGCRGGGCARPTRPPAAVARRRGDEASHNSLGTSCVFAA